MNPTPIPHSERLIVVVGPSGAGKDSVLRAWRERVQGHGVHFARRIITRPPEASEAHDSVSEGEFGAMRARGHLATWWHANGLLYGVGWGELAPLRHGRWVVLNGSRAHLPVLRAQAPRMQAVEITASVAVRAQRLEARGREDATGIARRLSRELPAEVAVSLHNDQSLDATVDALHDWWTRQHHGGAVAPLV